MVGGVFCPRGPVRARLNTHTSMMAQSRYQQLQTHTHTRHTHRCTYSHMHGPQTETALSHNKYRLGQTEGGKEEKEEGERDLKGSTQGKKKKTYTLKLIV